MGHLGVPPYGSTMPDTSTTWQQRGEHRPAGHASGTGGIMKRIRTIAACFTLALAVPLAALADGSEWRGGDPKARVAKRPKLLSDRNKEPNTSLTVAPTYSIGERVFFSRWLPATGKELWVSRGATRRARLVRDIVPGRQDSSPVAVSSVGDRLFFLARTIESGIELWVTDGTEASTMQVSDTDAETEGDFRNFFRFDDRLYFETISDAHGSELYETDGTAAGTRRVTDIGIGNSRRSIDVDFLAGYRLGFLIVADPGITSPPHVYYVDLKNETVTQLSRDWPVELQRGSVAYDARRDRFLVAASTPGAPVALWVATAESSSIRRIQGSDPSHPPTFPGRFFRASNGAVFFTATTPETGRELWTSDGTDDGTRQIVEIVEGPDGIDAVSDFAEVSGGVVFVLDLLRYDTEIWSSDGTGTGTQLLAPNYPSSVSTRPRLVHVDEGVAYYAPRSPRDGSFFLRTDGTLDGTYSLDPRQDDADPWPVVRAPFGKNDFLTPSGLRSDGTVRGTGAVENPPFSTGDGGGGLWFNFGRRMLFFANDGVTGFEPWITDGTRRGTRLFADLNPEGHSIAHPESGPYYDQIGDRVYFEAQIDFPRRYALFQTGGTTSTTAIVFSGDIGRRVVSKDQLVFSSRNGSESRLWATDDSEVGYRELAGPSTIRAVDPLTALPSTSGVLVSGVDLAGSEGLWFLDERLDTLQRVGTFRVGRDVAVLDRRSESGTDSLAIFSASEASIDFEPWVSDGTPEGTQQLVDARPGTRGSSPALFTECGGLVYFVAGIPTSHSEMGVWTTDGTPGGTRLLIEIFRRSLLDRVAHRPPMRCLGDLLYFAADDGAHGNELWRSDGTLEGTRLVKEIRPGPDGAEIFQIDLVDGRLLFSANDGVHGEEAWMSDGTPQGTILLFDNAVGTGSSRPRAFHAFGKRVFFSATRDRIGAETFWFPRRWLRDPEKRFPRSKKRARHSR